MKNKKSIVLVLLLIITITSTSLALGIWNIKNNENKISTGEISFSYNETNTNIEIENATSLTDEEGTIGKYFSFDIEAKTTSKSDIGYYIYLTPTNDSTIDKKNIKVYLTKLDKNNEEEKVIEITTLDKLIPFDPNNFSYEKTSNNLLLYSNYFPANKPSEKETYRLRFWLKDNYIEEIETTSGQISVDTKTFKLNVNVIGINKIPKEISK